MIPVDPGLIIYHRIISGIVRELPEFACEPSQIFNPR
jgi:hypothetical protein